MLTGEAKVHMEVDVVEQKFVFQLVQRVVGCNVLKTSFYTVPGSSLETVQPNEHLNHIIQGDSTALTSQPYISIKIIQNCIIKDKISSNFC